MLVPTYSVNDAYTTGKVFMNRANKKLGKLTCGAPEDRRFRACFGIPVEVLVTSWNMMIANDLIPDGGLFSHYFWALMFMKLYPENETEMCTICGGIDPNTFRKWAWPYITSLAELSLKVVSNTAASFIFIQLHI